MTAEIILTMKREDIQARLPYAMICTTRESSIWDTGKRRKLWKERFTPEERSAASKIFAQAHDWYLKKGVPDEIRLSTKTFSLWERLVFFCVEISN